MTINLPRATLKVVKRLAWLSLFLLPFLVLNGFHQVQLAAAQAPTIAPSIFFQNPREGQALQGIEIIEGKIRGDGFSAAKLTFSYTVEGADTWFFIADILPGEEESSQTSFKTEWDTTQITDGNYHLRLVAEYEGKATIFELIQNLRVRNQSPVETATSAPLGNQEEVDQTATPTRRSTPQNTPTPLPVNPVVLEVNQLYRVLVITGILVVGGFLIGFIYFRVRNRFG
ncbi:MAG: hypothetical protein MUO54_03620 [Anaerolineales bacterium]|nr:hypothetical protein [Anaerolineales bacterium]